MVRRSFVINRGSPLLINFASAIWVVEGLYLVGFRDHVGAIKKIPVSTYQSCSFTHNANPDVYHHKVTSGGSFNLGEGTYMVCDLEILI
jgi:hypothetical protein